MNTEYPLPLTRISQNISSHIELQFHASSALDNPVTLTFDLFTSGSMHAERLYVYL